mmetsp:Transcript_77714/g.207613  ORF Transcript_77714/g.207613 Transcript_77714/m.207613 type:complete len:292 (-) Transcript_77714:107-982(-)
MFLVHTTEPPLLQGQRKVLGLQLENQILRSPWNQSRIHTHQLPGLVPITPLLRQHTRHLPLVNIHREHQTRAGPRGGGGQSAQSPVPGPGGVAGHGWDQVVEVRHYWPRSDGTPAAGDELPARPPGWHVALRAMGSVPCTLVVRDLPQHFWRECHTTAINHTSGVSGQIRAKTNERKNGGMPTERHVRLVRRSLAHPDPLPELRQPIGELRHILARGIDHRSVLESEIRAKFPVPQNVLRQASPQILDVVLDGDSMNVHNVINWKPTSSTEIEIPQEGCSIHRICILQLAR